MVRVVLRPRDDHLGELITFVLEAEPTVYPIVELVRHLGVAVGLPAL